MSTTGGGVKQLEPWGAAITRDTHLAGSKVLNFGNKGLSSSNDNGDVGAEQRRKLMSATSWSSINAILFIRPRIGPSHL